MHKDHKEAYRITSKDYVQKDKCIYKRWYGITVRKAPCTRPLIYGTSKGC